MLPAPRADLKPNTADFERLPLVKPTGFTSPKRIGNNGLAVTPDGKRLVFPQLDDLGSNLMLVEHFR